MSKEHEWAVGDLCKAVYNNVGEGLIYRVTKVGGKHPWLILTVKPVYGIMANTENRKVRTLGAGYCTYVSLADLGMEYMNFGTFIRDYALSLGMQIPQLNEKSK